MKLRITGVTIETERKNMVEKYSFDPKCEVLAKAFLDDTIPNYSRYEVNELAQVIQDAIDATLEELQSAQGE